MVRKRRSASRALEHRRGQSLAGHLPQIVLGERDRGRTFEVEFQDTVLSGEMDECSVAGPCNVVRSVLDGVEANRIQFERCDFKDTSIRDSVFRDSALGHSSWFYNSVNNTRFERCSFTDMSLQNSDFQGTVFKDCDLRNIIIKACRFDRCQFIDCTTNNKVFETSRFSECAFRQTQLQIESITENFGLSRSQYEGAVRSGRADRSFRLLSDVEVAAWGKGNSVHPLSAVSIHYFLHETLLDGSLALDRAADLKSWMPSFRTANSFTVTLDHWIEFLLWLFERNQVSVHTLLAFHSMTDQLIRLLETHSSAQQGALGRLSGTHLSLARAIDVYLELLDTCLLAFPNEVSLLVEGRGTPEFYYQNIAPLFERSGAKITKVVPHNSPWELTISFGPASSALLFMAFFLATRTSFELAKVRTTIEHRSTTNTALAGADATTSTSPSTLVSLRLGLGKTPAGSPGLRLKAFLPCNLLAEFKLEVSSKQIAKIRKVLKDLL